MEYIILWIACGIGAAAIASSKGRSVFGWLIGGFLLGPIGLLIVGLMGKPAPDESTLRKCPHCAEKILKEAKVCKHCGRDVPPVEVATVICQNCGARVAISEKRCPKCKHRISS